MRFNRVFDTQTFDDLRAQLWSSYAAGKPAAAVQKGVTVYANAHYGVPAGTVDITWRYLSPVKQWSDRLHQSVKDWMKVEFWNYDTFPNYSTVEQLHLDSRQVNLLASLAASSADGA
jgi:hypothetical protein